MAASDDLGTRIMRLRNKAEQMRVLARAHGVPYRSPPPNFIHTSADQPPDYSGTNGS